jgi:hypothetical protein
MDVVEIIRDAGLRAGNSITLLFSAPAGTQVAVRDRALAKWNANLTDRWDAEYFRQEGATLYVIVRPNAIKK